jgi:hypothetical protein
MEIPDSINMLTTEVQSSSLTIQSNEGDTDVLRMTNVIRQCASTSDYSSIEEGLAFYKKDILADKNIVKNFLLLYCDTLNKAIKDSDMNEDFKAQATRSINDIIKGMLLSIDSINDILVLLNKKKNLLDVRRISCIMLGYAIAIIKKTYNH